MKRYVMLLDWKTNIQLPIFIINLKVEYNPTENAKYLTRKSDCAVI